MKILSNLFKRNTALLLLLSMCMGCFYTGYPLYVKAAKAVEKETAAEDWELEDNGSKSDATELVPYKMGTNYTTSDIDYYVYKATGNNEVGFLQTCKNGKIGRYYKVDRYFRKKSKKYTYKIRSYVKVNGKTKYGKFSYKTIKF